MTTQIAECSGKMNEFTREYGQRPGPGGRSIPHLPLVDELLQKNRKIDESLKRIRDLVIAQTQAMEQQMKDSGRNGPGSYQGDHGYGDDRMGGGGFANGDTKKRRGVSIRHSSEAREASD
jgi:hypothetical protein